MSICKNHLQSTVGAGAERRFPRSRFCRAIYLIVLHGAMVFHGGINHRTSDDMESGKSSNAGRDSAVLPIEKVTRRATVSFLHHLVSFGCNCNHESDNWACASDRRKATEVTYLTGITLRLSEKPAKKQFIYQF